MKVKMLNQNLLCSYVEEQSQNESFIYNKGGKFLTLSVESSATEEVKKGDIIKVSVNSGEDIEIENEFYRVVNIRDIILVL